VPRKLSIKELTKLLDGGASIEAPDDQPLMIEGLEDVLNQLRAITEAQQQSVQDQSVAIATALNQLTEALANFKGGTVDMRPLEKLVTAMKTPPPVERPNYQFNVQRNTRGFITGMTVAPQDPTIN